MALPVYGGTMPAMASFYGQPGVGYMGTAMPPTGVAGMPYTQAGFGATAYPSTGMYGTPAYQSMGAAPYQGGYPPSTSGGYSGGYLGGYSGVNGFNMPPTMQSFNGAGYYGCGAGMVDPFQLNPSLGMIDPYNPYMGRMNPMGSYAPSDFEDFEDDPMSSFRSHNSHYGDHGGGMRMHGSFRGNDGHYDHHGRRSDFFHEHGRGSDSYYDPQRQRYVQRRPKQACC